MEPKKRRPLRKVIIIGGGITAFLCIAIALISQLSPSTPSTSSTPLATRTPRPTNAPSATRTPRPTNTPRPITIPTDTPTIADQLRAIVDKGGKVRSVDRFQDDYTIKYLNETLLSEKSFLQSTLYQAMRTIPALFAADPALQNVRIIHYIPTVDIKGNEGEALGLNIAFDRETSDDMNWQNVLRCNLPKLAADFRVHRILQPAWTELCSQ